MYSRYTMWDNINLRVNNGNVELTGAVSQPYKKSEIGKIVQKIPGVVSVTNRLQQTFLGEYICHILRPHEHHAAARAHLCPR